MATPAFEDARQQMLRKQLERRGIGDRRVLAAMGRVPRERFVSEETRDQAYADRALPIGCGQTISQPYIVGLMTQALRCSGRETVLEIGTGSGYQTAVLAELAGEVISVERHAGLSKQAGALLAALGYRNVTLAVGDGTLGWPSRSPYDRILVTAAAERCPPALFEQLKEGGILVIPIGGHDYQTLQAIRKVAGSPMSTTLSPCRFVPLVGAQGWAEWHDRDNNIDPADYNP
ncbi:MAG: protein-L-isoaspartate O-methyltransferase [Planctomycetes bacterium RBG_16_64_12]|nr:MAG: protein-L-isoaspartate O-methyltransferase [Planctomycetes bacterium RBG_16_64_12]